MLVRSYTVVTYIYDSQEDRDEMMARCERGYKIEEYGEWDYKFKTEYYFKASSEYEV